MAKLNREKLRKNCNTEAEYSWVLRYSSILRPWPKFLGRKTLEYLRIVTFVHIVKELSRLAL